MLPNHKGSAKANVNDMCLLLVNTYGNNPMKLFITIKKKILIKIKIVPWITVSPNTAFNSLSKKKVIFKNVFENWEFINQYIWGRIKTPMKTEIQFNIKE